MARPELPETVEAYRDQTWRRDPERLVDNVAAAEGFVESVGFCAALTDSRRPGPSLYVAVCGRRDAHMPRNVQKDPESSLSWFIKNEIIRRGKVYYAKLARGRSTFVAPRLLPHFQTLWGVPKKSETTVLSKDARQILAVLRREWEMGTRDLRNESGVTERQRFTKALDELQKSIKVIPSDVISQPSFTYIWTLTEARFPDELSQNVSREQALKEIARAYLQGAGMTPRGELARVTGLPAPEAGLGNWALVDEEFAIRVATGVYCLKDLYQSQSRAAAS
jgi:hypothetical protein